MIQGGGGVNVLGSGTIASPYVISSDLNLSVVDSASINLSLSGNGSVSTPYVLSANTTLTLGGLDDVSTAGGVTGYVLARQSDGTYALVPPSTAAVGAISVGNGLEGDGSAGNLLRVKLAPSSGLTLTASGLAISGTTAWSTYTPVMSSSNGSNITLDGASSLEGRYRQDGKTVHVTIQLTLSANFNPPSGRYRISLPVADKTGTGLRQHIQMTGNFTDDGSDPVANEGRAYRQGYGSLEGTGRIERIYVDRGGYSTPIGSSYPRWRAYAMRFTFSGSYEAN